MACVMAIVNDHRPISCQSGADIVKATKQQGLFLVRVVQPLYISCQSGADVSLT